VAKSWKCRLGLHQFVRRRNDGDPNDQICIRCRRERTRRGDWLGGPW